MGRDHAMPHALDIARYALDAMGAAFFAQILYRGFCRVRRALFHAADPQLQMVELAAGARPPSPRRSSFGSNRAQMGSPPGNRVAESAPVSPRGRAPEPDDGDGDGDAIVIV